MRRIVDFDRIVRRGTRGEDTRPPICEVRLRCTSGLRGSPPVALSAWRGRSGRRYVVGVHDLDGIAELLDYPAVALAVRRDERGLAVPVVVATLADLADHAVGLAAWGLTEIHVHRLAATDAERQAAILDLRDAPTAPPMQHQAPRPSPIVTVG